MGPPRWPRCFIGERVSTMGKPVSAGHGLKYGKQLLIARRLALVLWEQRRQGASPALLRATAMPLKAQIAAKLTPER
jgi:hypothetical protein